jgi:DNA invertase Pin-like site-specific DNA recombinase
MAHRRKQPTERTEGVIAYLRVSTEEQAASGLGLVAQRALLAAECDRRGVTLLATYEDAGRSGKDLGRPALQEALDALDAGQASALMVAKLDRLTRSVHDASGLMKRAERAGWGLVALDVAVDTTTPQGTAMAQVLVVFAELERRLIGQRTRDALAAKKAQGHKLGRPRTLPEAVRRRRGGRLVRHRSPAQRRRRAHRPRRSEVVPRHRALRRPRRPTHHRPGEPSMSPLTAPIAHDDADLFDLDDIRTSAYCARLDALHDQVDALIAAVRAELDADAQAARPQLRLVTADAQP